MGLNDCATDMNTNRAMRFQNDFRFARKPGEDYRRISWACSSREIAMTWFAVSRGRSRVAFVAATAAGMAIAEPTAQTPLILSDE